MSGWALPDSVLRDAPAYAPRPFELGDLELLLSGAATSSPSAATWALLAPPRPRWSRSGRSPQGRSLGGVAAVPSGSRPRRVRLLSSARPWKPVSGVYAPDSSSSRSASSNGRGA